MLVQIRTQNPGHQGAWRAGRFFPNGVLVRMEVVEGEKPKEGETPKNGPLDADGKLDMTRIDKAGFEAIKNDPRFSVLSDEDTQGSLDRAAFDEARRLLRLAQGELSDAKLRIAGLEAEKVALATQLQVAKAALGEETEAKAETAKEQRKK